MKLPPNDENSRKSTACVVFSGRADLPSLRFLKPGFRHCFLVLQHDDCWVMYEPLSNRTEITVIPKKPDFDLIVWLRQMTFTVLSAEIHTPILQPIVDELGAGRSAMADEARLEQQFGGTQKWTETRRQLQVWGQRHLPPDAYASLSSSYDGVLALHRLMQSGEPSVLRGGTIGEAADEGALRRMIRDPRYWRDRDPAILRKVSDGFKRLYPQE